MTTNWRFVCGVGLALLASALLLSCGQGGGTPPSDVGRGGASPADDGPGAAPIGGPAAAEEAPAPVVVQVWQQIGPADAENLRSQVMLFSSMSEEDRDRLRHAVYRIEDMEGRRIEVGGEVFTFPSVRQWFRPFSEEMSALPRDERIAALKSVDALFYGVMNSKETMLGSWREAQRAQHGPEVEQALGAPAAEWLVGTPWAYVGATSLRGWIAARLAEVVDDPAAASEYRARADALARIVRSGRFHEGNPP